jgi:hypothetical protein
MANKQGFYVVDVKMWDIVMIIRMNKDIDNQKINCARFLFISITMPSCCDAGKIVLNPFPPLPRCLLDFVRNPAFRPHIRKLAGFYAFANVGTNLDRSMANAHHGVYTYRIHGAHYHRLNRCLRANEANAPASFAQFYVYDALEQEDARLQHECVSSVLRDVPELRIFMQDFRDFLAQNNPFAINIQSLVQLDQNAEIAGEVALEMRLLDKRSPGRPLSSATDTTNNRRLYNLPTAQEIAAIRPSNDPADAEVSMIMWMRDPSVPVPPTCSVAVLPSTADVVVPASVPISPTCSTALTLSSPLHDVAASPSSHSPDSPWSFNMLDWPSPSTPQSPNDDSFQWSSSSSSPHANPAESNEDIHNFFTSHDCTPAHSEQPDDMLQFYGQFSGWSDSDHDSFFASSGSLPPPGPAPPSPPSPPPPPPPPAAEDSEFHAVSNRSPLFGTLFAIP